MCVCVCVCVCALGGGGGVVPLPQNYLVYTGICLGIIDIFLFLDVPYLAYR